MKVIRLTDNRFIIAKYIVGVSLVENANNSTLTINTISGQDINQSYLKKEEAFKMYNIISNQLFKLLDATDEK